MEKKYFLIFAIILIIFTNCESYLDQNNPNKITTDTFFKTEKDFLQALAAAYVPLRNPYGGYYNARSLEIRNYRADDVSVRNDTEPLYQIHLFTNDPDNKNSHDLFEECYSAIYRVNMILERIENSTLSEDFKNQIKGEALFLRGLNYFILTKEYKDVPLRLISSQSADDFPIAKSTQNEIIGQVEKDLLEAIDLLPVKAIENGRATKGAGLAYLGKLYIYSENWTKAINTLKPLLSTPYSYKLTDNYYDNFDLEHEYNSESIFEVTYQKNEAATSNWGEETINTLLTTPMNRIFACGDLGGWDVCNGSSKMLGIITSELDIDGNYDVRARNGAAWDYPGCIYYLKPFKDGVKPANQNKLYIQKYTYSHYVGKEIASQSEINIRAYRFANVILYLAEAELRTGNLTGAINYINQIRKRANLKLLSQNASSQEIFNDLVKQRAIEFFAEGERFYDLRRWKLLENEIKNSTSERAANFSQRNLYLPIPSKELQTNPLCTQAEGW